MKVEIKIDKGYIEPICIIHTANLSPELVTLVDIIEGADTQPFLLIAKKDEKSYIIKPDDIDIIRTEGGVVKCYDRLGQDFYVAKPLQELLECLPNNFIRISKSAIVNVNRIDHLSSSFNRTMYIIMKNSVNDYVSKKYLKDIKNRLGL